MCVVDSQNREREREGVERGEAMERRDKAIVAAALGEDMIELLEEEEIEGLACAIEAAAPSTSPGAVGMYPTDCGAARRLSIILPPGSTVLVGQIPGRHPKAATSRRQLIADWVRSLAGKDSDAKVHVQLRPVGGCREPLVMLDPFARAMLTHS